MHPELLHTLTDLRSAEVNRHAERRPRTRRARSARQPNRTRDRAPTAVATPA
jgi:hypothetical protein